MRRGNQRKEKEKKENKEKMMFSFYVVEWKENEKKENENYIKMTYMSLL